MAAATTATVSGSVGLSNIPIRRPARTLNISNHGSSVCVGQFCRTTKCSERLQPPLGLILLYLMGGRPTQLEDDLQLVNVVLALKQGPSFDHLSQDTPTREHTISPKTNLLPATRAPNAPHIDSRTVSFCTARKII